MMALRKNMRSTKKKVKFAENILNHARFALLKWRYR